MANERLNIPKKLKVGFQKRTDTYSGKLAYVVYLNSKNEIAKEKSWSGWIDKKIPVEDYDNEPMEGFVLNKKAGDYNSGWNHRMAKCRVFDPRGFEVEISIDNLLYILQECTSSKGKGLEGEFIYAWSGKDLVLLPTCSPDYEASKNLEAKKEKIGNKDLNLGSAYKGKEANYLVYLGKQQWYSLLDYKGTSERSVILHLFLDPGEKKFYGYKNPGNFLFYKIEDSAFSPDTVEDWIEFWKNKTWTGHGSEGVEKLGVLKTKVSREKGISQEQALQDFLSIEGKKAYEDEANKYGSHQYMRYNDRYNGTSFDFYYKIDDRTYMLLTAYYEPTYNGKTKDEYMKDYEISYPKDKNKHHSFPDGYSYHSYYGIHSGEEVWDYLPWSEEEKAEWKRTSDIAKEAEQEFYKNAKYELSEKVKIYEKYWLDESNHVQSKEDYYKKEIFEGCTARELIEKGIPAERYFTSEYIKVGVMLGDVCTEQEHFYKDTSRNCNF